MVTPRSKFSFAFSCFNHLDVICNCCYFGIIFIYRYHNMAFIHIMTIQTNKIYSIKKKKIKSIIINMLHNINNKYSYHNNNKYVTPTIKYIKFEPINYTIN